MFLHSLLSLLQKLYTNVIADGQKVASKEIKLDDCKDEDDFFSKIEYERYIEISE